MHAAGFVDVALAELQVCEDHRWEHQDGRHLIREAVDVDRDAVFGDLFRVLG